MDFNQTLFLQILVIGISTGALIALISLGYTLVYGIIELINFAHGDVFMMGAFSAATLVAALGVTKASSGLAIAGTLFLALVVAMIFCAALNLAIDRVAYKRLRNAPRLAPLIAAIGISFILQNLGIYWKGPNSFQPTPLFPGKLPSRYTYNILEEWFGLDTKVRIGVRDVAVVGISLLLLAVMNWIVYRTTMGKAMRATAQDREAAQLMGIDINRTIGMAFILGGALAGAAGMIAAYYNDTAKFNMGFRYGLFAFTAAVLGGIGNLAGTVLGAFSIGIIAAMSDGFMKEYVKGWGTQWTTTVVFGVLVLVMIFRPSGLLGEQTPDRA